MSVCKYDFEPKINVECTLEIIGIVRAGEIVSKRGEVLQHAGAIIGELGAFMSPEDEQPFAKTPLPEDDLLLCKEIEDALEAPEEGEPAQVNPLVWTLVIELIKRVLNKVLN